MLDFTCLDAVLFVKVSQNLLQYMPKNSPVFCSDQCFLDFCEGFRKTWFHLPRRSSVCKSCSVFVAELVKEAKTCCCVGILKVFCSDQCFLYFGAEFQENY